MSINEVAPGEQPVRVWDLPTRTFHWLLAGLVIFSIVSAKIGGGAMVWHLRSGYAILTLLALLPLTALRALRYDRRPDSREVPG